MRKYMHAEVNRHQTILTQMGAKVQVVNSLLCYVTFDLTGTKISYVYNVNKKNKYFLERIEPYPESAGTFKSEDDVIDTIKIDIEQFKNAKNCKVFHKFLTINQKLSQAVRSFEDLYLYYNVAHEDTEAIYEKLNEIETIIKNAKDENKRVYFKKDPDCL